MNKKGPQGAHKYCGEAGTQTDGNDTLLSVSEIQGTIGMYMRWVTEPKEPVGCPMEEEMSNWHRE